MTKAELLLMADTAEPEACKTAREFLGNRAPQQVVDRVQQIMDFVGQLDTTNPIRTNGESLIDLVTKARRMSSRLSSLKSFLAEHCVLIAELQAKSKIKEEAKASGAADLQADLLEVEAALGGVGHRLLAGMLAAGEQRAISAEQAKLDAFLAILQANNEPEITQHLAADPALLFTLKVAENPRSSCAIRVLDALAGLPVEEVSVAVGGLVFAVQRCIALDWAASQSFVLGPTGTDAPDLLGEFFRIHEASSSAHATVIFQSYSVMLHAIPLADLMTQTSARLADLAKAAIRAADFSLLWRVIQAGVDPHTLCITVETGEEMPLIKMFFEALKDLGLSTEDRSALVSLIDHLMTRERGQRLYFERELTDTHAELDAMRQLACEHEAARLRVETTLAALQAKNEAMQALSAGREETIKALRAEVGALEGKIQTLQKENAVQVKNQQALQGALSVKEEAVHTLQDDMVKLTARVDRLLEKLNKEVDQRQVSERELKAFQKTSGVVANKLGAARKDLKTSRATEQSLRARVEALEKSVLDLTADVRHKTDGLSVLAARLERTQTERAQAVVARESAFDARAHAYAERERLAAMVEELRKRCKTAGVSRFSVHSVARVFNAPGRTVVAAGMAPEGGQ